MDITTLLLGFGVGFTGMGSGALMTPLLILVLGVRPVLAVGSDLAYAAVTKIAGAVQHFRQDTVDLRTGALLGLGSVPGALVGVKFLSWYKGVAGAEVDVLVQRALGGSLVLAGLVMFLVPFLGQRFLMDSSGPSLITKGNKLLTVAVGGIVGLLVGLTSVGSGSLLVPFLYLYFRFPASKIVGTDVFHGALLVTAAAVAHGKAGNVDVGLMANLLLGSLWGASSP